MDVRLEGIRFNHIAGSATSDGFSLRRNEAQAVARTEWQRSLSLNPEDSPAAYAIYAVRNQTLEIQARITCSDPKAKSLWIRAVDGNLVPCRRGLTRFVFDILRSFLRRALETNVLGTVAQKEIEPCTGPEDFRTFELEDVRLEETGVGVNDIVWRWQYSTNGTDWIDIRTTRHRIYVVLKLPAGAWQPNSDDPSNTQLPWTDVLDVACRWAAGATSLSQIVTMITNEVNALGPGLILYDSDGGGSSHYTKIGQRFDCGRFLELLRGESVEPDPFVNCDDCAAIVSSFANALGCNIPQSSMESPRNPQFLIRRHQKIGRDWEDIDFFNYHAAAWAGEVGDNVSDACLKLDAAEDGAPAPIPLLACDLLFGEIGATGYRFHLVGRSLESECEPRHDSLYWHIGLS
jgi:hypothetical protein